MKASKSGFTLIEVMLVISLIGLLSILLMSNGSFAVDKATKTSTLVDIGIYQIALEAVIRTSDQLPASLDDLANRLNNELDGQFLVNNQGAYIQSISRQNKNGDEYRIYTTDFSLYRIECGEYGKEIGIDKEGGIYEERVYDN